jgi:Ca2+-binding RTX toxin-like protein
MSGFASIFGGSGDETLSPSSSTQANLIDGGAGNDVIGGLGGNDTLIGGAGNDVVFAGTGHDVVLGQGDNDRLFGEEGNDALFGGDGADSLQGGIGNDTIMGGTGDDVLSGEGGSDAFAFDDGFGNDLIVGFQIGVDILQIASGINSLPIANPADLVALISNDGMGNAVITLGSDTITLQGISPADLTANIGTAVQIV